MTLAGDIAAERAALVGSLVSAGPSAHAGCGPWTGQDLAAHLVAQERAGGATTFIARSLVNLPTGIRVTARTGELQSSVGPESGPAVTVDGTPANVVRWLAGRRAARIDMRGADAHVRALRAFDGHI